MDRRAFLAGGAIMAPGMLSRAGELPVVRQPPPATLGALLNRSRASSVLKQAGLDGVILASTLNIYYATNAVPVIGRFSTSNTALAVLPQEQTRPIAYITDGFEYYAGASDSPLAPGVQPYLVGGGFAEPPSIKSPAFSRVGSYAFDARDLHRQTALARAAPFQPNLNVALQKALRDLRLDRGRLGYDTLDARTLAQTAAPRISLRAADDLMLHVRLVKTPAELELMRRASVANVDAALAAARAAREEGSIWSLRQRFFQEAAARGNLGVYGSIDLVMSELADGPFRDGQAFMIDFVSHYAFYQGDYGRTVYFGDPDPQIRHAADIGITAWKEIREQLRPGLRFSDIFRIGTETVRGLNEPFVYAFHPHSVGLQHWDHPREAIGGGPLDITLEPGMVLSVDCPLLNAGVNGTTHLEDLMLITGSGAEALHPTGDETIQV